MSVHNSMRTFGCAFVCVCVDALWCFMTETDSYSHFKFKQGLLLSLNSKVLFVIAGYFCS